MIVVVASRYDETARGLVARWEPYDAALLTCEDLSVSGWRYYLGSSQPSTAVVGGREVSQGEIGGVLTRLPCVYEQELRHIVPADRSYVAAEMTSFLLSWLSGLACPVLNRPTPTCLSGPNWRSEQWIAAAAKLGIPVRPMRREITRGRAGAEEALEVPSITVTVVGDRSFGTVDEALTRQARRLADAASMDLLAVQFSCSEPDAYFVGANAWPDVTADDVADAVINYFLRP